jgi:hypothetical protein
MIDKSMLIVSDKLFNADVSNLYFPDVTELTQKNQLEGFVLKEKMQLGSDILFQFRKESSRNLLP